MRVEWWSVDFKTGQRMGRVFVADSGEVSRIIGQATDAQVKVRCSQDGVLIPGWEENTEGRRVLLVAVDADSDQIIWGGLVRRHTSDAGAWVTVSVGTVEEYLDQCYIDAPISWTDQDPSQVAVDVLALVDLAPLTVRATMTGNPIMSGLFDWPDRKRISEVLSDVAKLAGGPEWTIDLEWVDADHTLMRYVVVVAPRLGRSPESPTQWTMPGCVTGFEFIRDWGENHFANDVVAFSSGEGESKPRSTRYEDTALLASYARFERRFDPARSVTDTSTLDQYAEAELARVRFGLTQLTLTARLDAAPRVGLDWHMGDDIDVSLTCDRFPRVMGADGFWQPGYERRLRTVGWRMNLEARTVAPIILEAS